MATKVLTNAKITIDSNDLTADGNQVDINYEAETLDETAFGDDTRVFKGGLKNWSMSISFHQDYADDQLDEILFNLIGTQVTCAVRPEDAAISTSNPEYTGTGLIVSYSPISGGVGELAGTQLQIQCAGTLTRDVTP